ncbi:MAG: DUF885 domain-containing protein [Cyclobacteriaceae bacterium]|nr:DUF885 domain-containing protein [Cyclobacteriaceae bacterium]
MKKTLSFLIPALMLLYACGPSDQEIAQKNQAAFDSLKVSYHSESFRLNPLRATSAGDNRYNDRLPNTITEAYRQEQKTFYEKYQNHLASIDRSKLSEDDQLSYDLLTYECERSLEGLQFKDYLMPISQIRSLTLMVAQLGSGTGNQPFKTVKDYENWLSRLDGYVAWCDTAIVNMRKGMASGYVIPKALTVKVIPQLANFDHGPAEDLLYFAPIKNIPADFSEEDKSRLTAAYKDKIENSVVPANKRLRDFIEVEYLPACRESSGIDGIPGGKEYYDYLVRYFTTTDKTADEIFKLGLSEVDRISAEMEKVKEEVGFKGDLKAFLESLRTDLKLRPFKNGEDIIAYYNAIHDKMKPNLTRLFERAPKAGFEVRRIEAFRERTTAANYNAGSEDGTRPGVFYFPSPEPENYSIVGTENLFLHEAIPGHHYQIMLKIENKELPDFRRYLNYGAYTEGWALYTESLGKDLGLYTDPYLYFGMLSSEMHRAIRLVVDAGMHSQGWTREQAIQFSKDHEAASEQNIISEIERYMGMPGQALSYKMGQLKILELRAKAEKELGDKFDIRKFHSQILDSGSLPLETLEQKINQWIESSKNS